MQKYITLLICVFFLSFAFAQTADDNFEKAGQVELDKAENQLGEIKDRITVHLQQIVKDSVINKGEMRSLKTLVNEFHKTQKKLCQDLLFYNKQPVEGLSGWEDEILRVYFNQPFLDLSFKDDQSGTIRKYFIENAGYDITVLDGPNFLVRCTQGTLLGIIFGVLIKKSADKVDGKDARNIVSGVVVGLLVCVLFIFVF